MVEVQVEGLGLWVEKVEEEVEEEDEVAVRLYVGGSCGGERVVKMRRGAKIAVGLGRGRDIFRRLDEVWDESDIGRLAVGVGWKSSSGQTDAALRDG